MIPGLTVRYKCPECDHEDVADISRCFSDMPANETTVLDCFCHSCSHEWEEKVVMNVRLEPVVSNVAL